jgi:sterol carrier protein 2
VKKLKAVYVFKLKGPGGQEGIWVVDAKNGSGSVTYGEGKQIRKTDTLTNR